MAEDIKLLSDELQEIFCSAVDTIVGRRLSDLKFDKTVEAVVVDNSFKDLGLYTVQEGATTYEAQSQGAEYAVNDKVLVQIPNGDYSYNKVIIGKADTELKNQPAKYVSPMEMFISTDQVQKPNKGTIIANGSDSAIELLSFNQLEQYGKYNAIAITGSFQTKLNSPLNNVVDGTYGIRIRLYKTNIEEEQPLVFEFNNKNDFLGDTYNYSSYFQQEQVFAINGNVNFTKIKVELYQNGDFKLDNGGEFLPEKDLGAISVKDLTITFGYAASLFQDNTVQIYADRSELQAYPSDNDTVNLNLIWFNKDENNKYLGFTDGNYVGKDATPADDSEYQIRWYYENVTGVAKVIETAYNQSSITLQLNPELQQMAIHAVVQQGATIYKSNVITYKNSENPELKELENKDGLAILNDAKSQNSYPLYRNNLRINSIENLTSRVIKPVFIGNDIVYSDSYFNGWEIEWRIPKSGTMLRWDDKTLNEGEKKAENDSYYYLSRSLSDTVKFSEQFFSYRIADSYQQSWVNNTIVCILKKDDKEIFRAEKSFTFSKAETMGTGYRLEITTSDPVFYSEVHNSTTPFEIYVKVFNMASGEEVSNVTCNLAWIDAEITNELVRDGETNNFKLSSYPKGQYAVLVASANLPDEGITIKEKYSLAYTDGYSAGTDYPAGPYRAEVPTSIIYDNSGTKTFENNYLLHLYSQSGSLSSRQQDWAIYKADGTHGSVSGMGAPQIKVIRKEVDSVLVPSPVFYQELDKFAVGVIAGTDPIKYRYWQPLIIEQDKYGSSILNTWDGNFQLDDKNGTIMSSALMAGKKDTGNTFSGVIMGQIGKLDNSDSANSNKLGLYGYDKGDQTFGISTDGTAFLGKAGSGRIWANGNEGYLASSSWMTTDQGKLGVKTELNSGETGTLIDLDDGVVKMINNGGRSHFKFDKEGLDIKADSFSLASGGSIGGPNLLKNTAPIEEDFSFISHWGFGAGARDLMVRTLNGKKSISFIDNIEATTAQSTVSQSLQLEKNTTYTLSYQIAWSGEISENTKHLVAIYAGNTLIFWKPFGKIDSKEDSFENILVTFTTTDSDEYNNEVEIRIGVEPSEHKDTIFYLHHLKLEEGPVATAWSSNDNDTQARIDITNNSIIQQVEGMVNADYYGKNNDQQDKESKEYKNITITYPVIVNNDYAQVFQDGIILAATFDYDNINKGAIRLNITTASDETPPGSGNYGYPIYYNGVITSDSNPFIWTAGSTIYFRFTKTGTDTESGLNTGYWSVIDPYGVGQLVTNTQGITGDAITRDGDGFRFQLEKDSFKVGPITDGEFNPSPAVLSVDKTGLKVVGDINATSGSFNINDNFIVDTSGNVTLNGNITWGAEASPTQVVYARTALTKPANNTSYSSFPETSTTAWHKTFDGTNDKFASYTYDGGKTWGNAIGIVGTNGKDGKGISSTEIRYATSTSGTTAPSSGWQTTIPSVAAGGYLWTRTVITYTDNTKTTSYAVGAKGTNGTNGTSVTITHIKYAIHSSNTTPPSTTSTSWNTSIQVTSGTNPYLWSWVKYSDGNNLYTCLKGTVTRDELWGFLGDKDGIYKDSNGNIAIRATAIISGALQVGGTAGSPDSDGTIFYAGLDDKKVRAGGFVIDQNSIYKGTWTANGAPATIFISTGTLSSYKIAGTTKKGWVLGAGSNFGVDNTGKLYATGADISGVITATGGDIGGLKINQSTPLSLIKTVRHSVSSSTAGTNYIKISNWNSTSAWYNYYYKILPGKSLTLKLSYSGTEVYTLSSLPTGNSMNFKRFDYQNLAAGTHTYSIGTDNSISYLLINQSGSTAPTVSYSSSKSPLILTGSGAITEQTVMVSFTHNNTSGGGSGTGSVTPEMSFDFSSYGPIEVVSTYPAATNDTASISTSTSGKKITVTSAGHFGSAGSTGAITLKVYLKYSYNMPSNSTLWNVNSDGSTEIKYLKVGTLINSQLEDLEKRVKALEAK